MKKKLAALILVLVLALSCVGAMAFTPVDLLGTWYTGEADDSGDVYLLTGDYYLELNRDSTAVLVMNGQQQEYAWKVDSYGAVLTPADGSGDISFTYEDGQLKVYMKDFSLEDGDSCNFVFSREKPELFQVPETVTVTLEDQFFGEWKVAYSVTPRGVAKASEQDASIGIKVEYAQITVTMGDNVYYALTNFTDGKLTCSAADLTLGDGTVIVEMTDNGFARISMDGVPAETYNYYLEKIDAAAVPEEVTAAEDAASAE